MLNGKCVILYQVTCRGTTTGLLCEPARWSCDNCQGMSDFDSCQSNRTHMDGLHNWKASQVGQDLLWHLTSAYMRCVYGWAGGRYVITRFSRMDSLLNFVTHGAFSPSKMVSRLCKCCCCLPFSLSCLSFAIIWTSFSLSRSSISVSCLSMFSIWFFFSLSSRTYSRLLCDPLRSTVVCSFRDSSVDEVSRVTWKSKQK